MEIATKDNMFWQIVFPLDIKLNPTTTKTCCGKTIELPHNVILVANCAPTNNKINYQTMKHFVANKIKSPQTVIF